LPASLEQDADRLARFELEARALAALNHPHVAAIYGFEEVDGRHAIVLELVEGPTLDDRLKRGAIEVDDALRIAHQIADALEAAHEKGIIHRDLKPANIKVTQPDRSGTLWKAFAVAILVALIAITVLIVRLTIRDRKPSEARPPIKTGVLPLLPDQSPRIPVREEA
jgi:serine/threonine-protein kinase